LALSVLNEDEIIALAREMGGRRFVGLFSGGKDSLATCHYMWKRGLMDEVLYCYTGIGLGQNVDYVIETCRKLNWTLHIEFPRGRFTYEELVRRYGFPGPGLHMGTMRWLKWMGIRRFNRANYDYSPAFVSGTRTLESNRRKITLKNAVSLVTKGEAKKYPILFFSPLFYWTDEQVYQYIKDNELELSPVYETMHMGGDCFCGCYAARGEVDLIATFHPDLAQKIKALEYKYGGKWGKGPANKDGSMTEALEKLVCSDCINRPHHDIGP